MEQEKAAAIEWARDALVPAVNDALGGRTDPQTISSTYGEVIIGLSRNRLVYVVARGDMIGQVLEALYPEFQVTTERLPPDPRPATGLHFDLQIPQDHCTIIWPI